MHTKGKWRIAKREGHSNGVRPVIYTKDVDRIAIISYRGVPSIEEAEANARRICQCVNSHEDLLDALEAISQWAESRDGSAEQDEKNLMAINEIAKQAIAKAEGR